MDQAVEERNRSGRADSHPGGTRDAGLGGSGAGETLHAAGAGREIG